jgi:hypothetical protein
LLGNQTAQFLAGFGKLEDRCVDEGIEFLNRFG